MEFRDQGITSILISYKLNELGRVADTITVQRDGSTVATHDAPAGRISEDLIVRGMVGPDIVGRDIVGRDMAHRYPERDRRIGDVVMEVRGWNAWRPERTGRHVIRDVDQTVHAGEILGIAGLMGSGRTELAMGLFGRSWGRNIPGEIRLEGAAINASTMRKAATSELAHVAEDRKELGLVLGDTVMRNTGLTNLAGVSRRGVIDRARKREVAESIAARSTSAHQVRPSGS